MWECRPAATQRRTPFGKPWWMKGCGFPANAHQTESSTLVPELKPIICNWNPGRDVPNAQVYQLCQWC